VSNILLVDDHAMIRVGILSLLKKNFPQYDFLEAGTLSEASRFLEKGNLAMVLCDISLNKESGLDLLQEYGSKVPFLMFSFFEESVYGHRCIEMGAKAYLNKGGPPEELLRTIRKVLSSVPVIVRASQEAKSPLDHLSQREREVLEDIANGMKLQEISVKRGIQYATVKTYKQRIMEKTKCRHNPELLFFALKHGIIPPTEP
jgi:DNA-binding NarL/FixJ family response regulator